MHRARLRDDLTIAGAFRFQADWCLEFGSPLTAGICARAAQALEGGDERLSMLAGWAGHPIKDALPMRFCGALHAAVLSGRASALANHYPPIAQTLDLDGLWQAALAWIEGDRDWVTAFLKDAPQTNETRRSIGLLSGFLALKAAGAPGPFHMLELGASAGLNLHWDKFRYKTDNWSWGPPNGPLMDTDWTAPPPQTGQTFTIASRRSCDLNPLNIHDEDAVLKLRAFIWADQTFRMDRLNGAIDLARREGVQIDQASADDWLNEQLSPPLPEGSTVVYHSIFYPYPPEEVRARIARIIHGAGQRADAAHQLHWVRMEPLAALTPSHTDAKTTVIDTISWPGGGRKTLAEIDPHARFVRSPPD